MRAPSFFVAGWAMLGEARAAEIFGAHKIWTELLCRARVLAQFSSGHSAEIGFYLHRDGRAAAKFDFIYTEMAARRRFEFYLHRDWCALEICF